VAVVEVEVEAVVVFVVVVVVVVLVVEVETRLWVQCGNGRHRASVWEKGAHKLDGWKESR